jgi:hypothetical protein
VKVRLADLHVSGRLEATHRLGGSLGHMVGEDRRPVGRPHARRVEDVLDRQARPVGGRLEPGDEDRVRG